MVHYFGCDDAGGQVLRSVGCCTTSKKQMVMAEYKSPCKLNPLEEGVLSGARGQRMEGNVGIEK